MTRPRSLFTKSQGTHHNIAPVPHDKFKYSQCVYMAPRTLIKCKQLRTKEQLSNNRGLCEEHAILNRICAKQFNVETELLKLEVDNKPLQIKYEKTLRLGKEIVDPEFLTERPHWKGEILEPFKIDSFSYDNPLSRATHVSEKEQIRGQLAALHRRLRKLTELRESNMEKARQRMQKLGVDGDALMEIIRSGAPLKFEDDDDPMSNEMLNAHATSMRMELELADQVSAMRDRKTSLPACSFAFDIDGEKKRCTENSLPHSELCKNHILVSTEQKVFTHCKVCKAPCIDFGKDSACDQHRNPTKDVISPGGTTRTYRLPNTHSRRDVPAWHLNDGLSPIRTHEVVIDGRCLLDDDDAPGPSTSQKSSARKKTWDGGATKPNPPAVRYNPQTFMAAIMGTTAPIISSAARRKSVNESHTMTCARVREFSEDEFSRSRNPIPRNVTQQQNRYGGKYGMQQGREDESTASLQPSRVYLPPPPSTSSSSQQDNLSKMYAKTTAYGPHLKKEPERKLIPQPTRQPPHRPLLPMGKTAITTQMVTRPLGSTESYQSLPSSSSTPSSSSSQVPRSVIHSNKPLLSTPSVQWSYQSTSRPTHLPTPRPPPQLKTVSLTRGEGLVPSQSTWTSQGVKFKPAPGGGRIIGGPQLPVRQAINEDKMALVVRRPSDVSRPLNVPSSSLPYTSQSPTKTMSNTSLPTLSLKEGGKETPLVSPLSTPPQLSLHKEQKSSSKESDESSERKIVGQHVPFNEPIEDIEEEDDFEEEL